MSLDIIHGNINVWYTMKGAITTLMPSLGHICTVVESNGTFM